jgi:hypothetical protein
VTAHDASCHTPPALVDPHPTPASDRSLQPVEIDVARKRVPIRLFGPDGSVTETVVIGTRAGAYSRR